MDFYLAMAFAMATLMAVWQALGKPEDSYSYIALISIVAGVLWPYMLLSWFFMGLVAVTRHFSHK
jgi:hypothetical protein